jgi:type III secretion system-like peptide-binding chaperone
MLRVRRRVTALTLARGEDSVANVDQTMMKVQRILTGPMGLRIGMQGNTITVSFTDSSTRVNLSVQEWGTNKDGDPASLVQLSCPILWEVDPTPTLYEWIARQGGNYYFGHVSAHDDSSAPGKLFLMMSHTLLGDYLDEDELSSALYAMLETADRLDDELKQKFGGKRLADYA